MLSGLPKSSVPNFEICRRKLLYFKTVYSRKIVQLSEELDIDEIPDIDFDAPYQRFDSVEQEITHLRERVKKLQRIVFHLKLALDEKMCPKRMKDSNSSILPDSENLRSMTYHRKEKLKRIRKMAFKRFPRKSKSDAQEILIKKLKKRYERKVSEFQEYCEIVERLHINPPISINSSLVQAESPFAGKIVHDGAITQPDLTYEEISAFMQRMCQPLPKPLSPIKSPERRTDHPLAMQNSVVYNLNCKTQTASRQLHFDESLKDCDNLGIDMTATSLNV